MAEEGAQGDLTVAERCRCGAVWVVHVWGLVVLRWGGGGQTGDHFCFYLSDLKTWFDKCRAEGIVWVNPRFTHLDETRTCAP
jgi:hypothetical protein